MIMRKIAYFTLLFTLFFSFALYAQDYTGEPRTRISNPAINLSWPYAAVNGKGEIGTFFQWYGGSGSPDGIAFRKLDKEGKPVGPQKFAYKFKNPSEVRGLSINDVVWANDHYFVLIYNYIQRSILLFKFTENGAFVSKTRHKFIDREDLYTDMLHCLIFGNEIYIPLTTGEGGFFRGPTSDIGQKGDRQTENYFLKTNLENPKKFEKVEFHAPTDKLLLTVGASADANHIVFLMYELWLAEDFEYINPRIVNYNPVTGEVSEPISLDAHKEVGFVFFFGDGKPSRPIYNGKGHTFFYDYYGIDYGYYSFIYDSSGKKIYGPVNLGQLGIDHGPYDTDLVGSVAFMGNHHYLLDAVSAMMIGPKGKHIKNIFYEEDRGYSFAVASLGQVFTGNHVVFIYNGVSGFFFGPTAAEQGFFVYSKAIPTPKPIKDGISFFQAGSAKFQDGSRHLIWSTVGSEGVTIKHDGKEYTNLPPYFSFQLPDANSKKPVELTFTSAAGKTYSRKIKLK
jgi:hypothetical protein